MQSKGELTIINILNKTKLKYETEKTFEDLCKGRFRFDFYINSLHGRRAVIEFNGAQHYEFVSVFYPSERMWRAAKERDRQKISYCLANDIDIYIIPYWDLDQLHILQDLIKPEYKATSRWHNDEVWDKKSRQK